MAMFGMRCEQCGEVRWSILDRAAGTDRTCPACGAQMAEERRHPGHHRLKPGSERRVAPVFPARVKLG
jgi:predicted RNA-binding Zn-ribbon protein involved in translation (DUF1610 family)